ncbi:DUF481 domain-containing protein [Providencia stuartii]|nr:DUF481 domain-containing protein [Providencia stuartii]AXO17356.1 DUF481 domain-containing protein [Providencia stuartii]EMA3642661.1 DUF481 domain-containing protein [Providencia stuartii]EMD1715646.1 DUF481 domain-containing protein [Providencia stuartii]MBN5562037.1 DUF481 domain-containing protein [Providencia stuartii]MBN5591399.1 DUF481 domain-containing protein [Providencia stuartii]
MRFNLMRYLAILIIGSITTSAYADNIYLKNGDSLSGMISIIDDNKVLIKTSYAGELRVKLNDIKTFDIDEPVVIKLRSPDKWQQIDAIEASKEGEIILISGDKHQNMKINDDLVLSKKLEGTPLKQTKITGGINAGATYNKGASSSEKYSFDANMQISAKDWRHGLNGAMLRNKDDHNVSSYYYNLGYELDYFINPSFFWRGSLNYQHDWIEDIKSKGGVGTGPGWQVWNTELSSLSFTGLLSYQHMTYRNGVNDNYMQGSLAWDFNQYLFAKTISIYTKGRIGRGFNNDVSLDLNARLGMMYHLTDGLNLNASIIREKINADKGDSNNTNYTIGVGYKW